jgi:hypothetical protein
MAATVGYLEALLGRFVPSDDEFTDYLNMLGPTLYALGNWRDLVVEKVITTDHAYVGLPRGYEALLAAMIGGVPNLGSARWQDYKTVGMSSVGPAPIFGLVDDGIRPVIIDLATGNATGDEDYNFKVEPDSPSATLLPSSGTVYIEWIDVDGATQSSELALDGSASVSTTEITGEGAKVVNQIIYRGVPEQVKVSAVPITSGDTFVISRGRLDELSESRRYRFANENSESKEVTILMKRKWVDVKGPLDVVHLSTMAVMKHALLGQVAENNSDLDAAEFHWSKCREHLENEAHQHRGGIRIKVNLDPTGNGGNPILHNY